ncbi:MAG: DUF3343 domain-containing protein [Clostridia bacterium]|nr:DUF3343 domain-containing protein [Clostridia bacterium]
MEIYIITVRSVTYAQKTVGILSENRIKSRIIKRPKGLDVGGCGYAVEVRTSRIGEVTSALADAALPDFKIYKRGRDGYVLF